MTDQEKLEGIKKAITAVMEYPPVGHPRRDEDGYPTEIACDDYAYRRMIDSIRSALKQILEEHQ